MQSKLTPINATGIHEAVKGVFSKRQRGRNYLFLLMERFIGKGVLKSDLEHVFHRKAAYLIGIARFEKLANMKFFDKMRNIRRKEFTGMMIMCYNIHGISPPFVL